jgi:hypothetical protein
MPQETINNFAFEKTILKGKELGTTKTPKKIYSVNIKSGTKFIVALCDVFWKIAWTGRFYFEKCHPVTYNLFK